MIDMKERNMFQQPLSSEESERSCTFLLVVQIFASIFYDARLDFGTAFDSALLFFLSQHILTRDIFVGSNLGCYNDHIITVDPSIAGPTGFVYTFGEILNTGKTYV